MPAFDFDLHLFCENLKATKPPYQCPAAGCGRVYKTYSGIQFHLFNYDHDQPDGGGQNSKPSEKGGLSSPPQFTSASSRGQHRRLNWSPTHSASKATDLHALSPGSDTSKSHHLVEVNFDGQVYAINIFDPIEIIVRSSEVVNHAIVDKSDHVSSSTDVTVANLASISISSSVPIDEAKPALSDGAAVAEFGDYAKMPCSPMIHLPEHSSEDNQVDETTLITADELANNASKSFDHLNVNDCKVSQDDSDTTKVHDELVSVSTNKKAIGDACEREHQQALADVLENTIFLQCDSNVDKVSRNACIEPAELVQSDDGRSEEKSDTAASEHSTEIFVKCEPSVADISAKSELSVELLPNEQTRSAVMPTEIESALLDSGIVDLNKPHEVEVFDIFSKNSDGNGEPRELSTAANDQNVANQLTDDIEAKLDVRTEVKTVDSSKKPSEHRVALPFADFKILADYVRPPKIASSIQTPAYFKFTEKKPEELDAIVEYDMDEEVYVIEVASPVNFDFI